MTDEDGLRKALADANERWTRATTELTNARSAGDEKRLRAAERELDEAGQGLARAASELHQLRKDAR